MFGTKTIATKLVVRARQIAAEWTKSGQDFIAKGDPVSANRQLAVAATLEVLAALVQEVFDLDVPLQPCQPPASVRAR